MSIRTFAAIALAGIAAPGLAAQAQGQTSEPAVRTEVQKNIDANFGRIDTDSNGKLSKAEFDAAEVQVRQQAASAIAARVAQEFSRIDTDKDGRLSLAEFQAAAPSPRAVDTSSTLQRLDTNRDGTITAAEFRAPILARFDRMDANRDGRVTADERSKVKAAPAGR